MTSLENMYTIMRRRWGNESATLSMRQKKVAISLSFLLDVYMFLQGNDVINRL